MVAFHAPGKRTSNEADIADLNSAVAEGLPMIGDIHSAERQIVLRARKSAHAH